MFRCLLACLMLTAVSAYSTGAPEGACDELSPNHGAEAQSSDSNPYQLVVGAESVRPGGQVEVTLYGTGDTNFLGFLIVAKDPLFGEGRGTITPLFNFTDPYVIQRCNGAGITHSKEWKNKPYFRLPLVWTAPDDFTSAVTFYGTAVQEKTVFWSNFEGQNVVVPMVDGAEGQDAEGQDAVVPTVEDAEGDSDGELPAPTTGMDMSSSVNETDGMTTVPITTEFEFEEMNEMVTDSMLTPESANETLELSNNRTNISGGVTSSPAMLVHIMAAFIALKIVL